VKPLEEARILMLDRCEKFPATHGVGGRDGFENQASSECTEPAIDGLMIPQRHAGAEPLHAAEVGRHTEPAAIPHARRAFIDPNDTDDRVFHPGDECLADDRYRVAIDLVAIGSMEDLLFLAKDLFSEIPIARDFRGRLRDFEQEVLRSIVIKGVEKHHLWSWLTNFRDVAGTLSTPRAG